MQSPEIPVNMQEWGWMEDPSMPTTDMQALMEAAPGNEPAESREALQVFREAVADCLTVASFQDVFILNAYEAERLSYSQLATRLGCSKSQAEREHKKAHRNVASLMRSHPIIQERHNLQPTTWNEAAADAVNYLSVVASTTLPVPFEEAIRRGKLILSAGWEESGGELTVMLVALGASAYGAVQEATIDNDDIIKLLVDRHTKYGVGNILEFREYGLLIRMSDKVARIKNGDADFEDDSYLDAFLDLVGYAAIAHMLDQDTFKLPLEGH